MSEELILLPCSRKALLRYEGMKRELLLQGAPANPDLLRSDGVLDRRVVVRDESNHASKEVGIYGFCP